MQGGDISRYSLKTITPSLNLIIVFSFLFFYLKDNIILNNYDDIHKQIGINEYI